MYINGEWLTGEQTFPVYNPATGEEIARVTDATRADAARAIEVAHNAFQSWKRTTAYERSAILYRAYELMLARKEQLAELMTREQGKPLRTAQIEVQYGADFLLWFAEEAKRVYGETIPSSRANQRFFVQYQPVGVVAAITPWNYPISMITRKVGPALAAGCTVVLKPAEATPLCAMAMFEILAEAGVPAGVINLITVEDPGPIGKEFCSNKLVRKLTFTGSTAVGQKLARDAAPQLMRVSMELGGHAPFIVYPDADPVHAAKGAALVKFLNTGQACICPNRIYVHRKIMEPFVDTFTARISKLVAGNGLEPGVRVGPLVNEAALAKVSNQVEDALAKGATLHHGGRRLTENGLSNGYFYEPTVLGGVTTLHHGGRRLTENGLSNGYFYEPTVLGGVTNEMLIYREETFGPVAGIIPFDDEDDIIGMANDTHYGLAAYIYTRDISKALRTFEGLDFGIIGINDINPTSAAVPFGGMKASGLGREGAREGLMEYLETKIGGFVI